MRLITGQRQAASPGTLAFRRWKEPVGRERQKEKRKIRGAERQSKRV